MHFDVGYFLGFVFHPPLALLRGLLTTVLTTFASMALGVVLGFVLCLLGLSRYRVLRWANQAYIFVFRGTPLLVQLFFLYYVLPEYGLVLPAFLTGALALGVQYSAYMSEVYRAGLESITRGQVEAARALDISPLRIFTVVILPQAIPRIIPALGNYLVSIMKDVPVLSVVSILELLNVARIIGDRSFNYMVPLTLVGVLYLILTLVASAGVRYLDEHLPKRGIPLH